MRPITIIKVLSVLLCILVFVPIRAYAGIPEVSNVIVTDVTTCSFSVIWNASEASTASLQVFENENGTIPVAGSILTPHPVASGDLQIKNLAEDNGVMKVRVTGLAANEIYFFRTLTTSKSTLETALYPSSVPLMSVKTETTTIRTSGTGDNTVPFSNDLIIEPCYLEDGVTPAEGTLLVATVRGGHHPVTAFVGDGVEPPYAIIDLNNIFNRQSNENLNLQSGENLTLVTFRGLLDNSIVTYRVPEDQSLCEIKPGDIALQPGWNMVSLQLEPTNPAIENIINSFGDNVDAIWTYDASANRWYSYDKNIPPFLNDLNAIHSNTGYWFVMNSEKSLIVNGDFTSGTTKNLQTGWNLVGSKSIEYVELMEAIAPIYDNVDAIWTYDNVETRWLSYDKNIPPFLNDLEYIEPGKSYWFVINQSCTW